MECEKCLIHNQIYLKYFGEGVLRVRPPQSLGQASHVRVDGDGRDAESVAQDDVGGLAPHPGQGDELTSSTNRMPPWMSGI